MELRVAREVGRDDLARLKRLFEAARSHDGHDPLGEHKWLDLVHGRRFAGVIATSDGELVGYAHVSRHAEEQWGLEIVTAPDHRDGLEVRLAEEALGVVASEGGRHVHYIVFRPRPIHEQIARRLGFRHGRELQYVCVRLPVAERAEFPPGMRLRAFELGRDEDAWLEVNNRAFAHHPEQGAWDAEMLRLRMAERWFDPRDLLLVIDDARVPGGAPQERIAGFNWTKLRHDRGVGEIYVIGIDPSRQGARLGKALTLAGLEHMARRGMATCCLYVDAANATAMGMYRRIGFEVDHVDRVYVKDV